MDLCHTESQDAKSGIHGPKLKYDEFVRGSPMSSITSISVSEYLHSSYSPDRDFVDGRVEERNVGEHDHAAVQAALILWFGQRQDEWNIEVLPEQRIRISATKFRVPDICLVSLDQPVEQILTKPPLACIEILSPEDTLRRMQERIDDYRQFGVPNIWVLDPATQRGYDCQSSGFLDATEFSIAGTPIRLSLSELFARIRR
ncbi:MAG: Uma2 family endonuclease [Candidatus Angelobacter sp.]